MHSSLYKDPKQSIFWNIQFASLLSIRAPLCGCGLVWTCEPKLAGVNFAYIKKHRRDFTAVSWSAVCMFLLLLHCAMSVFCFARFQAIWVCCHKKIAHRQSRFQVREGFIPLYESSPQFIRQGGCGGCFFAVLFISSVDVMQNCEGSLSRDKFLF